MILKTNVNIIDVREPAEIKATGSIKGSIKNTNESNTK